MWIHTHTTTEQNSDIHECDIDVLSAKYDAFLVVDITVSVRERKMKLSVYGTVMVFRFKKHTHPHSLAHNSHQLSKGDHTNEGKETCNYSTVHV